MRNVSVFLRSLFQGVPQRPHLGPDFLDLCETLLLLQVLTETTPTAHLPLAAKSNMFMFFVDNYQLGNFAIMPDHPPGPPTFATIRQPTQFCFAGLSSRSLHPVHFQHRSHTKLSSYWSAETHSQLIRVRVPLKA